MKTGRFNQKKWALGAVVVTTVLGAAVARGGELEDALRGLAAPAEERVEESIHKLAVLGDARAVPALEALTDDRLRAGADGQVYVYDSKQREVCDPLTLQPLHPRPAGLHEVESSNSIRRLALPVVAQLQLGSPDQALRLAAAEELAKRGSPEATALLRQALRKEQVESVRKALALAVAHADLQSANADDRLAAIELINKTSSDTFLSELQRLTGRNSDGSFAEPDPRVRAAASHAVDAVVSKQRLISAAGSLIYGISLASVLLFAALGLAVTFGLLGVINMAHGEMLMLGAYATYSVQTVFQSVAPGALWLYPLVAIPVAFAVTFLVGVLLERTVIRHLYGRPLETLLATWGISLILIQTVRLIFGAQNVAVANPDWLAGGVLLAQGLVLPYNRIGVVVFVVLVAASVWFLLQRTRLGLYVRAVTQNRGMAACCGIPTARIDAWMFGLGSGIAGLGGVALSQLGNVGPELGQGYIIDSFMVVVLGGVGRLAGAVAAALGLGVVNKILEPVAGAVLGKIAVLGIIIIFIQRRPQGLFAIKGRVEA
ncbi:MAG TPA: urea ABC transporter permease subunit UrtB [Polyangia bacterium]|nr:urea ABC transporter permease subunit UrtB [Polyangia bacterium]